MTRRALLTALGAAGGASAVYHGLATLGLIRVPPARAQVPVFPADAGQGRTVCVFGAGLAGLCVAYLLARHGFQVSVLEAADRIGGRSLTLRDGDRFREVDGPEQIVAFAPNRYADGSATESAPHFNAGPGRIPQHHHTVLDYCRRLGVRLEPYIFLSEANLLQNDRAFGGRPVPFRQIRFNLRGEIAGMLAKATRRGALDQDLSGPDREALLAMLRQFGDLERLPDGDFEFRATPRAGYADPPGAGLQAGVLAPRIPLSEILGSGFWRWDLFTSLQYFWQASLVQPVGGMDRIWQAFLQQRVPGNRTVRELVRLSRPVRRVRVLPGGGIEVVHGIGSDTEVETAEFAVSTMAPGRLLAVAEGVSAPFHNALAQVAYSPAVKVGLQMKTRFWEHQDGIYGGISWTSGITRQLWYPSSEYQSRNGVLVAAYNNGAAAAAFGALPVARRADLAAAFGEKLHPGLFRRNIVPGSAVSVAWQRMPHQVGGWAAETHESNPEAYRHMVRLSPQGGLYLAGDYLSHWPGWQEGALAAAELAFTQIADRVLRGG